MANVAVEELIKKRQLLVDEKSKMNTKFDNEIEQLESAIILLAEGRVWEKPPLEVYDDENPDYVRQSVEEI